MFYTNKCEEFVKHKYRVDRHSMARTLGTLSKLQKEKELWVVWMKHSVVRYLKKNTSSIQKVKLDA